MKLLLTTNQFNSVKENMPFIFNHYLYRFDEESQILEVNIPSYEDADYTSYMRDLKSNDRIEFCVDVLSFAI